MTLTAWANGEPRCTPTLLKHIEEVEANDDHQYVMVLVCFDDPNDPPPGTHDIRLWRENNAETQQAGVVKYLTEQGVTNKQFSIICAISLALRKEDALRHLMNIGQCQPQPLSFDHLSPVSLH